MCLCREEESSAFSMSASSPKKVALARALARSGRVSSSGRQSIEAEQVKRPCLYHWLLLRHSALGNIGAPFVSWSSRMALHMRPAVSLLFPISVLHLWREHPWRQRGVPYLLELRWHRDYPAQHSSTWEIADGSRFCYWHCDTSG